MTLRLLETRRQLETRRLLEKIRYLVVTGIRLPLVTRKERYSIYFNDLALPLTMLAINVPKISR